MARRVDSLPMHQMKIVMDISLRCIVDNKRGSQSLSCAVRNILQSSSAYPSGSSGKLFHSICFYVRVTGNGLEVGKEEHIASRNVAEGLNSRPKYCGYHGKVIEIQFSSQSKLTSHQSIHNIRPSFSPLVCKLVSLDAVFKC
jgi:hypothetical protein